MIPNPFSRGWKDMNPSRKVRTKMREEHQGQHVVSFQQSGHHEMEKRPIPSTILRQTS
ncbi:hypothetical protein TW65_09279 [Stemphylium lycopersici]|nr:hypothetical protein TW65_09279 [Stemphylium lycopersici]